MSNVLRTRKNLKKKLSFNDYSKPASQQDTILEQQLAGIPVGQQDITMFNQQDGAMSKQHDSTPVHHKGGITVSQRANAPVTQCTNTRTSQQDVKLAKHSTSKPVRQLTSKTTIETCYRKIKATYYLTEQENDALTEIYIKRLQAKNKTDKSALVGQAIRLLYKKESSK